MMLAMQPHFNCRDMPRGSGTRRRLLKLVALVLTLGGSSAEAAATSSELAGSKFCDHAPMPTCKSYCELESLLLSKDKCRLVVVCRVHV